MLPLSASCVVKSTWTSKRSTSGPQPVRLPFLKPKLDFLPLQSTTTSCRCSHIIIQVFHRGQDVDLPGVRRATFKPRWRRAVAYQRQRTVIDEERRVSKSPLSLATGISKVRSAQHSAQLTPVVEHSYYVTDTRGHPLLLQMRRRVPAIAPFDPGGVGAPGGVRRVDQGPG